MSNCRDLLAATALVLTLSAPALAEPLGLGRAALPEEIAAWDVVVLPDGTGLPPGRGNVLDGEELWVNACAVCHGDFGEGAGAWPAVVGGLGSLTHDRPKKTFESYWPHLSTAWDYVNRSMPFGNAQSLTPDEVYAIVAYMLYSGGLVEDDFELSHENFTQIVMPNVDGFYPDDRDTVELPLFSAEPCMTNCLAEAPVVSFRATMLDVTPLDLPPASIPGWAGAAPVVPASAPADPAPQPEPEPAPQVVVAAGPDPALVAEGERLWRQCVACHQVGEGARNGTGPALNGTMGRAAGQSPGFRHSPQLIAAGEAGLIWTPETLDAFLEDPAGLVPRNRMVFRGVRSAEDRAALIAYMSTFTD